MNPRSSDIEGTLAIDGASPQRDPSIFRVDLFPALSPPPSPYLHPYHDLKSKFSHSRGESRKSRSCDLLHFFPTLFTHTRTHTCITRAPRISVPEISIGPDKSMCLSSMAHGTFADGSWNFARLRFIRTCTGLSEARTVIARDNTIPRQR